MNPSSKSSDQSKTDHSHDADAWSAWACIIGIALGVIIGLFFGKALVLGAGLGTMGWIVGALIDRSRR